MTSEATPARRTTSTTGRARNSSPSSNPVKSVLPKGLSLWKSSRGPGRKASKGLVEQLAIGESAGDVVGHRRVDRHQFDLDDAALAAPDEIETGVDEQSMQPGIEPVGIAETRQVTPGG